MEKALFYLSYDGSALSSHEIDVKDLAPALLAVGDLLEEANRALNGDNIKVHVNLKATREGSVEVCLSVVQSIWTQAVSLFGNQTSTAIVNAVALLNILGFKGDGIIDLIKWLRNRPIKSVTRLETEDFKLELFDGDTRIASENEIKVFSLVRVRKGLESVVKIPLSKEGIEKVTFISGNNRHEINKDEAEYFSSPEVADELLDEKEVEMSLQIVNVSFQDGGKWKFTDGNATFFAEIMDKNFIEKVERNEAIFAKDDIIKAILLRKQLITGVGIKTDYTIKRVVEHKSAARQIKLPFVE